MDGIESTTRSAYIVELRRPAARLARELEARALAGIAVRTVEGLYLEPRGPLAQSLAWLEAEGVEVMGVRPATPSSWRRRYGRTRPGQSARLRDPRCACWLPLLA